jgi:pimeloyl-ACP methyl ester carboxylesterase
MYTHHPCLHPADLEDPPLSEAEVRYLADRAAAPDDGSGYSAIQSTRPDTLAAALLDSPAGLAAWIVEKYRAWGDCDGELESRFDKDLLLTVITLYWATGSIGTSFRPYFDDGHTPPLPPVTVPAGITLTREDAGYPREFAQRTYRDLRTWKQTDTGRHFLPLEEPALLAAHLRDFFSALD